MDKISWKNRELNMVQLQNQERNIQLLNSTHRIYKIHENLIMKNAFSKLAHLQEGNLSFLVNIVT